MFYIIFTWSIVFTDDYYDVIDELMNINEITCKNLNRNNLKTI